jgi:hypothetical protein
MAWRWQASGLVDCLQQRKGARHGGLTRLRVVIVVQRLQRQSAESVAHCVLCLQYISYLLFILIICMYIRYFYFVGLSFFSAIFIIGF